MLQFGTKEAFIEYLTQEFIPHLKKLGFLFTADVFEEAVYWLQEGEQDT